MGRDSSNPLGFAVEGGEINLASQAAGDVMYYNGTAWVRLAKGTGLQTLRMNIAATAPEWGSAGALSLLGTNTLVGAGTTLTVSSLTGNSYKRLLVLFGVEDVSGGTIQVSLYVENNTTATNYYTQMTEHNTASLTTARANNAIIAGCLANAACDGEIWIARNRDGYIESRSEASFYDSGGGIRARTCFMRRSGADAEITRIDLVASGNMAIGSWMAVYGVG